MLVACMSQQLWTRALFLNNFEDTHLELLGGKSQLLIHALAQLRDNRLKCNSHNAQRLQYRADHCHSVRFLQLISLRIEKRT